MLRNSSILILLLFIFWSLHSFTQSKQEAENLLRLETFPDSLEIKNYVLKTMNSGCSRIILENAWGPIILNAKNENISILKKYIQKSGLVKITALDDNNKVLLNKNVYVKSDGVNSFLESYISYPNLRAGSPDVAQIISLLLDKEKNLCDQNFDTEIEFLSPNSIPIKEHRLTDNFSDFLFSTRDKSQEVPFSVISQKSFSKPFKINIEANFPNSASISYDRNSDIADGQQSVRLTITDIKDLYGNVAMDGTALEIRIIQEGHVNNLFANVLNGKAYTEFIAPTETATLEVYALAEAKKISNTLYLSFVAPEVNFKMNYSDGLLEIKDLYTSDGHILEDGSYVRILIYNSNSQYKLNAQSENGIVQFDLAKNNIPKGYYQYTMQVLGEEYKGELNIK